MLSRLWCSVTVVQKLMVITLTTVLLLTVTMVYLAYWSYQEGLFEYSNILQQQRLEFQTIELNKLYAESGEDLYAMPEQQVNRIINGFPKRTGDTGTVEQPPPVLARMATALYDLQDHFVAGSEMLKPAQGRLVQLPLMYGNRQIGWIKSIPVTLFKQTGVIPASQIHWMRTIVLAVAAILTAMLLPFMFSARVIRPVRQLLTAVARVSTGDYDIHLGNPCNKELDILMRDIENLAGTLHKTLSSRNKWLANISHDMRTPLTVMTGEIQSIKDGVRELNLERLNSLEQEVRHLHKFTDDVYQLSLSEIGGMRYDLAPANVFDIVKEAVETLRRDAEQKQLNLVLTGESITIYCDATRLLQLFRNLLTNCVDHTDSPGVIQVNVVSGDGVATVVFEDTPPGVAQDKCGQIFEALYREDYSRNLVKKGGGLGLAICKNIVDAHHGRIDASPSELGGLRIVVELPERIGRSNWWR